MANIKQKTEKIILVAGLRGEKSFPQQGGKDKESSALTFAHKLAYMWFLDSPKRC